MCKCKHGSDRHYLDYAGPGVCGGILSKCLEPDCECKLFTKAESYEVPSQLWPTGQTWDSARRVWRPTIPESSSGPFVGQL
jgi:hypothetical protein